MRRRDVVPAMLSCLGSAGVGAASPLRLPTAASLPGELDAALRLQRPLVVMVSLEGCPFCKTVREHHLVGLLQEGQPVVQVDMRSNARVLDFAGQGRTHDEVIQAWKVAIAPTVLFFGKGAREAAPRLQGLSSPDFYGAYLEQRLEAARQDVRSRQR